MSRRLLGLVASRTYPSSDRLPLLKARSGPCATWESLSRGVQGAALCLRSGVAREAVPSVSWVWKGPSQEGTHLEAEGEEEMKFAQASIVATASPLCAKTNCSHVDPVSRVMPPLLFHRRFSSNVGLATSESLRCDSDTTGPACRARLRRFSSLNTSATSESLGHSSRAEQGRTG